MNNNQTYILMYYYMGKGEQILKGSASLLQHKKSQLQKESQFKKGLLTIISENGLKYNYQHIKP